MAEYIDRQTAIAGIDKMLDQYYQSDDTKAAEAADDCRFVLERIPAADVALVVHGRWYWAEDAYCRCTECNQKAAAFINDDALESRMTKFCPFCGAKMDGGAAT